MERPRNGWTMVEMVMVMVVGAVLAAVAIPSFQALGQDALLASAAYKMQTDIRYAQRLAMATGKPTGIHFLDHSPQPLQERYRVFDMESGVNVTDPVTGSLGAAGQEWSSGLCMVYPGHPEYDGMELHLPIITHGGYPLWFDARGRPCSPTQYPPADPLPLNPYTEEMRVELKLDNDSGGNLWRIAIKPVSGLVEVTEVD